MVTTNKNNLLSTRKAMVESDIVRFLTFELDRSSVDESSRTVALSFSSELPVERFFGLEILDHSPSSVRLGRLNNGGALLVNHDPDEQVGVVESATIDPKSKRGRAIVRFSKSDDGEEIFQDVVDGIRRLVSVGYRIHKTVTESKSGGVETVRVMDWEPFEISIVSIPADDSVGVGRGESNHTTNTQTSNLSNQMNTETNVTATAERELEITSAPRVEVTREFAPSPSAEEAATRAVLAERTRTANIQSIAGQMQLNNVSMDVHRAIADGTTPEAFREQALNSLLERQTNYAPGATVSRTEARDLSRFSIVRGLGKLMQGRALDGIEGEMHTEAISEARMAGINLEGNFHIPGLVLNHGKRDMTATGSTSTAGDQGGTAIATNLGSFIELLYARLVLRGLGAQVLTGLVGNLDLPKLVGGSTLANMAENAVASESNPSTGKITLSPKRASTFIEVSQQLLLQSSADIEGMVRNDLLTQLALMFEARAIYGSGTSSQPTGILNWSGIGSVAGGANGLAPILDHIIDLETAVATANADIGTLGYLTNVKVRGKLKKTSIEAATNAIKIWGAGDQPLNGYRAEVTTQVPSTLTKGSSSGVCSAIIFGNFSDLILAQWGGISIMANPYIKDIEGLVRLSINAYHDNAIRRAASFASMQDALAG